MKVSTNKSTLTLITPPNTEYRTQPQVIIIIIVKFNHRSHYKGDSTVNARYLKTHNHK